MLFDRSGPYRAPASGKKPDSLVLLFHGYGSNGSGIITLADSWAPLLPETLFIAPHATSICPHNPAGRQWFDLKRDASGNIDRTEDGVQDRSLRMSRLIPQFVQELEQLAQEHDLALEQIALVGFSQGAMLALYMSLYACKVSGVVSYSGMFCPHLDSPIRYHPPVLLVHGEQDDVVPPACLEKADNALGPYMVVEALSCPGLAHSINTMGMQRGAQFLKMNLNKKGEES